MDKIILDCIERGVEVQIRPDRNLSTIHLYMYDQTRKLAVSRVVPVNKLRYLNMTMSEMFYTLFNGSGPRENFQKYLEVQRRGEYNMLTEEARLQTGLSEGEYKYILTHYNELARRYDNAISIN